jgi:hypothetical protein
MYQLKHETQSVLLAVNPPNFEYDLITSESQWQAIKDKMHTMPIVTQVHPRLLTDIQKSNVFSELEKITMDFFTLSCMTPEMFAHLWENVIYSVTGKEVDMTAVGGYVEDIFLQERWILTVVLLELLPPGTFGIAEEQ